MKLVLDTNVVMELLHWHDPRSARLLLAIEAGAVNCASDADCLAELRRVLAYPQFARDEAGQQALHARYTGLLDEILAAMPADAERNPLLPRCRDRDDQKFMEVAARCSADLLVTRDRELLKLTRSRRHPPPFGIVTPEAALARLAEAGIAIAQEPLA